MVKVTKHYLIKHSDGLKLIPIRNKNDSDDTFLKKVTHLKLQGRFVEAMDCIPECENVTSLYLQNNILQTIMNIENFQKLTNLYLQRNKISKIENLNSLKNLKKLYLGYNEIAVVEGLEALKLIKELHIEYQNLPLGETIYFEPRTFENLAKRIEVINVSGNGLSSLSQIANMDRLVELYAIENKLENLQDFGEVMLTLPKLVRINLRGNPITHLRNFSNIAILNGQAIRYIDDKEINSTTRQFIEGWKKSRKTSKHHLDNTYTQNSPSKVTQFSQLKRACDDLTSINTPNNHYSFNEWKLRKNVNSSTQLKAHILRKNIL